MVMECCSALHLCQPRGRDLEVSSYGPHSNLDVSSPRTEDVDVTLRATSLAPSTFLTNSSHLVSALDCRMTDVCPTVTEHVVKEQRCWGVGTGAIYLSQCSQKVTLRRWHSAGLKG